MDSKFPISRVLLCGALLLAGCGPSEKNNTRTSIAAPADEQSATQAITNPTVMTVPSQANMTDEMAIIEPVRQWYRSKGYVVPSRIVVNSKTNEIWVLKAGAESKEATLKVNSKTRQVIEFLPGY